MAPLGQKNVNSSKTSFHGLVKTSTLPACAKRNNVLSAMDPFSFGINDWIDLVEEVQEAVVVTIRWTLEPTHISCL